METENSGPGGDAVKAGETKIEKGRVHGVPVCPPSLAGS